MEREIWKDVKGYEGFYQVSNCGRVKSLKRKVKNRTYKGKIMKLEKSNDGYLRVDLYNGVNKKHKKVHRLVAESFLDNYDEKCCVNHKDENRHNNSVNNLEICNYSYNINYGTRNEKVANKLSKKVNQYDLQGNFIKEWNSMSQIKRELGIDISSISSCCKGKIKSTKGFVFKFFDNFTNN